LQQHMDAQIAILEQGVANGTVSAAQFQTGVSSAMTDAGLSVTSIDASAKLCEIVSIEDAYFTAGLQSHAFLT